MIYSGSRSDEWQTPQELFDSLNQYFKFEFDLSATKYNCKTKKYFSPQENSLNQNWNLIPGISWLNPPFSLAKEFFEKAANSKNQIVAIYKSANTEAKVWQDFIFPHAEIYFIRGRIKYEKENKNSPTFGSALIFYRIKEKQNIAKITTKIPGTLIGEM